MTALCTARWRRRAGKNQVAPATASAGHPVFFFSAFFNVALPSMPALLRPKGPKVPPALLSNAAGFDSSPSTAKSRPYRAESSQREISLFFFLPPAQGAH
jgi:hypothetical protein